LHNHDYYSKTGNLGNHSNTGNFGNHDDQKTNGNVDNHKKKRTFGCEDGNESAQIN